MIFGEEPAFKLDISDPRLLKGSHRAIAACKRAANKCNVHIEFVTEPRAMQALVNLQDCPLTEVALYGMDVSHWSTYRMVSSTVAAFQDELCEAFPGAELLPDASGVSLSRADLLKDRQQITVKVTLKRWWVWPTPWTVQQQHRELCDLQECPPQDKGLSLGRKRTQLELCYEDIRALSKFGATVQNLNLAGLNAKLCAAKARAHAYEASIAAFEEAGKSQEKNQHANIEISQTVINDRLLAVKQQLPALMNQFSNNCPPSVSSDSDSDPEGIYDRLRHGDPFPDPYDYYGVHYHFDGSPF